MSSSTQPPVPWPNLDEYDRNRAKFTSEQLAPYEGQWAAFSSDGSQMIAAAPDLLELDRRIQAAGVNPEDVLLESIVMRDVFLGGIETRA